METKTIETMPVMDVAVVSGLNPKITLTYTPIRPKEIQFLKEGKPTTFKYAFDFTGQIKEIMLYYDAGSRCELMLLYETKMELYSQTNLSEEYYLTKNLQSNRCEYCGCILAESQIRCSSCGAPR